MTRRIEKPWGYEIWFAHGNGRYVGKLLWIREGHRLSLQYHEVKHETIYLHSGKVRLLLEGEDGTLENYVLEPGDSWEVEAGRRHRMEAVEDSLIFEVSTPEVEDVVRLEDDYRRT